MFRPGETQHHQESAQPPDAAVPSVPTVEGRTASPDTPPDLSQAARGQRTQLIQRHASHFGNQSTLRLLYGGSVQRDHLVRVPGVIDNGVMTSDWYVEVGGTRRSVPTGTYVEIYSRLEDRHLYHVRAYSGFGGIELDIPQSIFRHERQRMPPRRDQPVEHEGDPAEALQYARPGETVLDNGYLRASADFTQSDTDIPVDLMMYDETNGYQSTGQPVTVSSGTYVEVMEHRSGNMLRVRLHSGHHGSMALVEQRYFHHMAQIPDRERRQGVPDVGQVDQSVSIVGSIAPLWDATTGPTIADVRQQQIGDCYLLAATVAVMNTNPTLIRQMFGNPANLDAQTFTVRLYRRDLATYQIAPHTYTVDRAMLASHVRRMSATQTISRSVSAADNALWVPLLERAYAEHAQGYDNITLGGNGSYAMIALTGQDAQITVRDETPAADSRHASIPHLSMSDTELIASIRAMLAARRPMTAGTPGHSDRDWASESLRIFAAHEYAILSVDTQNRLQLHNPHGDNQPRRAITAAEFRRLFDSISTGSPLPAGPASSGQVAP